MQDLLPTAQNPAVTRLVATSSQVPVPMDKLYWLGSTSQIMNDVDD